MKRPAKPHGPKLIKAIEDRNKDPLNQGCPHRVSGTPLQQNLDTARKTKK